RNNDEVYFVVAGQGQFLVDGQCIDVSEGSAVRVGPAGARAWRNTPDTPLYFLCIQYRADSPVEGGTLDGQKVEGKPAWPDRRGAQGGGGGASGGSGPAGAGPPHRQGAPPDDPPPAAPAPAGLPAAGPRHRVRARAAAEAGQGDQPLHSASLGAPRLRPHLDGQRR